MSSHAAIKFHSQNAFFGFSNLKTFVSTQLPPWRAPIPPELETALQPLLKLNQTGTFNLIIPIIVGKEIWNPQNINKLSIINVPGDPLRLLHIEGEWHWVSSSLISFNQSDFNTFFPVAFSQYNQERNAEEPISQEAHSSFFMPSSTSRSIFQEAHFESTPQCPLHPHHTLHIVR